MPAVDLFHVDCAVTLKRIFVYLAPKPVATTYTSWDDQPSDRSVDHPARPQPPDGPRDRTTAFRFLISATQRPAATGVLSQRDALELRATPAQLTLRADRPQGSFLGAVGPGTRRAHNIRLRSCPDGP